MGYYDQAAMEADWYEDPFDRYDGRFFDGETWTERVSDGGVLRVDPDFGADDLGSAAGPVDPDTAGSSLPKPATAPDHGDVSIDSSTPAVTPVDPSGAQRATAGQESPSRVVAVLDDEVVRQYNPRSVPDAGEAPGNDASAGHGQVDSRARSGRRLSPLLLLLLIPILLVPALLWAFSGDDSPRLDEEQVSRIEDLQAGPDQNAADTVDSDGLAVDLPDGMVDPNTDFAASELIEVGSLQIANGSSFLADLAAWHAENAGDATLGAGASCWFGNLGGGAGFACAVVGGVDDFGDLGDHLADHHRDAVAQGSRAHGAALAAAAHGEIDLGAFDLLELGPAAVCRKRRIDLLRQQLRYLFFDGAGELDRFGVAQWVRSVGIADYQTALHGVARQVQGCASQLVNALRGHDDGQLADGVDAVRFDRIGDWLECQVVGVIDICDAGNFDPKPKGFALVLGGAGIEHCEQCLVAHIENDFLGTDDVTHSRHRIHVARRKGSRVGDFTAAV